MELLGIAIAAGAGLVLAPAFCFGLLLVWRLPRARKVMRYCSYALLALAAGELVFVGLLGAVRVRQLVGPAFFLAHLVLAATAAPALAIAIVLRESQPGALRATAASFVSYCVGFSAILFHIAVAESLFGIDGVGGRYQFPY